METESQRESSKRAGRTAATMLAMSVIAVGSFLLGRYTARPTTRRPPSPPNRIVVYYFHRTVRCPTCQRVESYAEEALRSAYPEQLNLGRLQWQMVDYEASDSRQLVTDYRVTAPCLVVVKIRDNQPGVWRSLPDVWKRIADKPAFTKYIQQNVREYLDYLETPGACCT